MFYSVSGCQLLTRVVLALPNYPLIMSDHGHGQGYKGLLKNMIDWLKKGKKLNSNLSSGTVSLMPPNMI